jgi:4'-phosphopantetheinyl transferase
VTAQVADLENLLSRDELARGDRYASELLRARFISARGALRGILACYLGHTLASDIKFRYGAQGKPAIDVKDGVQVQFNLAHAEDMALLALTAEGPVGVDLERVQEQPDWLDIARRFFSSDEIKELEQCGAGERNREFFRLWTCKEAYVKARGGGLSIPLNSFSIQRLGHDGVRGVRGTRDDTTWSVRELSVDSDYVAAVAIEGNVRELDCRAADATELAKCVAH